VKGVILAGGRGSRLLPMTRAVSKQLLPIYDKPMIFYPLTTLILAGIREILIVCNEEHLEMFRKTLGDGEEFGVDIQYKIQGDPRGIAHGLYISREFLNGEKCCLILGDNILYGSGLGRSLGKNLEIVGAKIFAYTVANPSEYGVVNFDVRGQVESIEEKPQISRSNFAIPGLYFLDEECIEIAKNLSPSARGELEITDLLKIYLKKQRLSVEILPLGTAWLDTGTIEAIHDASAFVRTLQVRQGLVIGDPKKARENL
jgi:glucose-1-phosphate thymidylyltransferase